MGEIILTLIASILDGFPFFSSLKLELVENMMILCLDPALHFKLRQTDNIRIIIRSS